ncbi:putative ABC transport system ATP-binding protein [Paenibacillus cellulosilyticus]|uniref:Putative ABC transport system ATP-binding protein n=1 Tax=Paenibacillus cellulosilyticus TaxID=375489 RepID=A0A2V2YGS5_9BACL|nr:ABC transporter ATP-binding protein [Paenibacillus cellulosilyticus]PWV92083.1 putative ABC transport system ATP-binding protein [Paenibacillus cellulosilyticus]QKS46416.1 ABC transporter ATP-binding protein [Paenibacillus cellulosilyticus]
MSVLKAQGLTKVYGSKGKMLYRALNDIHLDIQKGEFVGVMGPSGSGKTTLLNILATIDKPTSGKVEIGGVDPTVLNDKKLALFRRRELGFIFQDFNLLDTLSIQENIILPLVLDNTNIKEMEKRLQQSAELLGISGILDKRTYEVSGGQKQRAAIARAMIHQPAILLADELTGNLDSKAAKDVMDSLRDLNEQMGATIMMVTHDPFAASYCKRIVFIKDGAFFSEIRRGTNRQAFFQQILDSLSVLGGNFDELSTVRN